MTISFNSSHLNTRKSYMNYFILVILFLFSFSLSSQVPPKKMIESMGRGINIGNVLSAPSEGIWAPALKQTYLQDIKDAGFKCVRIPVDFFGNRTSGDNSIYSKLENTDSEYSGSIADYIINPTYLERVEQVIQWSLDLGLFTILDFHGQTLREEFLYTFSAKDNWSNYYTHPSSAKRKADNEKFRSIWIQIANRFKDFSDNLLFEIVNEPFFWLSDVDVNNLNKDIIKIIRDTGSKNKTRNIIITGGSKNSFEAPLQISNDVISSDNYLIGTFHYYLPRDFTSSSSENHNDFDWGSDSDKLMVDNHFQIVKDWSNSLNIPIFLGEFGADNEQGFNYSTNKFSEFGGPDRESREIFHSYLAEKALDLGFSFAAWDAGDRSEKTIYIQSNRSWVEGVKNALLGINQTYCLNTDLIKNADIECGANVSWSLFLQGNSIANVGEASVGDSKNNTSLKIEVTNQGSDFNQIILKNETITSTEFSGKTYVFSTHAKGSTNNQQFKIRIKTISDGVDTFNTSPSFNLSSASYEKFDFEIKIPENTSIIEFQLLFGKDIGTYFFDDFSETFKTLSIEEFNKDFRSTVYPNPTNGLLFINNTKKIKSVKFYDSLGKVFQFENFNNSINLRNTPKGVYFLQILFQDNTIENAKILIKNNL